MTTYYCPNNHGVLPLPMNHISSNSYFKVEIYQCPACLYERRVGYNVFGMPVITDTPPEASRAVTIVDQSSFENDNSPSLGQVVVGGIAVLALLALLSEKKTN
ncbi:MAG: hypothetical protein WCK96_05530 [Methylococcales bacterium]